MLPNRAQLKHPTTATSSPCPWSVGSITATPAKQPPESPSTRLHCPPRRTAAGRSIRTSARPPFGRECHSPSNPSYFYLTRIVVSWNFQIRFGFRYPHGCLKTISSDSESERSAWLGLRNDSPQG